MFATIVAFLAKIGLGGIVDKAIHLLERRAELEVDKDKLRTELTAEYLRQTVEEVRIMADYNKAKLQFPWFWCFAALFLCPLGMWWAAVIFDSIFHFGWAVADLPTQQMKDAASRMIEWVFYTGAGVAALKAVVRR